MKHLIEWAGELLLCHMSDMAELPDAFTQHRRRVLWRDLLAWDVTGDATALAVLQRSRSDYSLNRYLDRLYLWAPSSDSQHRQALLDMVFEAIAGDYEQLVHPDQNRENIRILLESIRTELGELNDRVVVDYGCGVGLSMSVAVEFGVRLIGVDRSPSMREAAAARGMKVWTLEDLALAPEKSLDGVIASYLFHLLPDLEGLRLLWSRLRLGGVLAANFHKGVGMEVVRQTLEPLGARKVSFPALTSHHMHGPHLKYVRAI